MAVHTLFLLHSHLLAVSNAVFSTANTCLGDGIGRRAGLKIRCRKAWRFESAPRHHSIWLSALEFSEMNS